MTLEKSPDVGSSHPRVAADSSQDFIGYRIAQSITDTVCVTDPPGFI